KKLISDSKKRGLFAQYSPFEFSKDSASVFCQGIEFKQAIYFYFTKSVIQRLDLDSIQSIGTVLNQMADLSLGFFKPVKLNIDTKGVITFESNGIACTDSSLRRSMWLEQSFTETVNKTLAGSPKKFYVDQGYNLLFFLDEKQKLFLEKEMKFSFEKL
ncbi:MAG: hypothetical protein IAF38_19980, partial [Bacteroidia bacterium]|nr:hypothetical protein [Bacteroidia bacterium]